MGLAAMHHGQEGRHLLQGVGVLAIRRCGALKVFSHIVARQDIQHALLAAADNQRRRAGDERRTRGAKIKIDVVEVALVTRREIVADDDVASIQMQFDEAVAVVLAVRIGVELAVARHQVDVAVRICRGSLAGLPDAAVDAGRCGAPESLLRQCRGVEGEQRTPISVAAEPDIQNAVAQQQRRHVASASRD